MPKKTARRIIDTKRDTGTTILTGVTVSGSPGSGASAAMAGDGLTYSSGVLNVGAGTLITVGADSVGITAGSTYQYIGTVGGTVAAWQNLSTLAGAGLTHSAGVLAIGAGNGITVNADDVALTTPGTLTVSTSNSATGSHTHAITSSSNPGANARLLASTASGGLTLQSLAVQGSVDVTNGGDLTVAGSGSYAGSSVLFVDSSGGNVGIMGTPDPQFALDIWGPARAEYWIGPHALQIADALMICHYDGRYPFATNFTGEPNGHQGQVATVTGGAIYRQGKFGKALQVAGATTNNFLDPSCEYDASLTQWSKYTAAGTFTGTRATDVDPVFGTYVATLTASASAAGLFYQSRTIAAGSAAVSAYVRRADGAAVTSADVSVYSNGDVTTTYTAIGNGWYRITGIGTSTGATHDYGLRVKAGKTVYADGLQLEYSGYATPFCDGTLGSGHSWSGTAMLSTSSRTAAAVGYTLATIRYDAALSVMGWFNLQGAGLHGYGYLWYVTSDAYSAYYNISSLFVGGVNCGAPPSGWFHVALVTAGDGTVEAFVNGVSKGTASITRANVSAWYVGGQSGGNQFEGLIDDFAIISRALPDNEVMSIYESDAPIFAKTSTFSFRATPQGLVWADDEGLWMRNSTGGTVLGAYGGAATKSWAGLTLSPSDVVIGDSSRGSYAWWDDSAGAFAIGKGGTDRITLSSAGVLSIKDSGGAAVFTFDASAGAEFTKPLTIGTSGGIYQGSGTFASPTDGLKVYNAGGIGQVAVYDGGVKTMRITDDDVRMLHASAFADIRTVKWLEDTDYSGTWSDLSTANVSYSYIGGYRTSTNAYLYLSSRVNNTGSPANTRHSQVVLAASRNDGSVYTNTLSVVTLNSTYSNQGLAKFTGLMLDIDPFSSTPTYGPSTSSNAQIYVKGGLLIVRYQDGATLRYKYLTLTGTGTTWTHTTTAP